LPLFLPSLSLCGHTAYGRTFCIFKFMPISWKMSVRCSVSDRVFLTCFRQYVVHCNYSEMLRDLENPAAHANAFILQERTAKAGLNLVMAKFHYADFPVTSATSLRQPVTSPLAQIPGKFRRSWRNGIWTLILRRRRRFRVAQRTTRVSDVT